MTKKDIACALANKYNLTVERANDMVDTVFDSMIDALSSGDRVVIRRLGVFKPVTRSEKAIVSGLIGANVVVPERKSVRFVIAKDFKRMLNERG